MAKQDSPTTAQTSKSSRRPSRQAERLESIQRQSARPMAAALERAGACRQPHRGRYCFRFQPGGRPLGEAEGAFLLCGFWLALAYAQQGNQPRALQIRSKLPQAFVHALMLEGAARSPTRRRRACLLYEDYLKMLHNLLTNKYGL